jgi:hypothetical protein
LYILGSTGVAQSAFIATVQFDVMVLYRPKKKTKQNKTKTKKFQNIIPSKKLYLKILYRPKNHSFLSKILYSPKNYFIQKYYTFQKIICIQI